MMVCVLLEILTINYVIGKKTVKFIATSWGYTCRDG